MIINLHIQPHYPKEKEKIVNMATKRKYVRKVAKVDDATISELANELNEMKIGQSIFPVDVIDVYLYYLVEPLGKSTNKYMYYTHVNGVSGYITLPTHTPHKEPPSYIKRESKSLLLLDGRVRLHVMKYTMPKREYTYEGCTANVNRKRKCGSAMDIEENGMWDYDFCQIKLNGLSHLCVNKYIFTHGNEQISFEEPIEVRAT